MQLIQIVSVIVEVIRLPLRRKFIFGENAATESDYAVVTVTTSDGVKGISGSLLMNYWGFAGFDELKARAYEIMPQLVQLCAETINRYLRSNTDAKTPTKYWDDLHDLCVDAAREKWGQEFPELAVCVALAAFEFAIWDAYGKTHKKHWAHCVTSEFLGHEDFSNVVLRSPKPRIDMLLTIGGADAPMPSDLKLPAYAESILVQDTLPTTTLDELVLGGVRIIKPKSSGNVQKDVARMAAIDVALLQYREDHQIGFSLPTYFDANGTAGDPANLRQLLEAIHSNGVLRHMANFEQPFSVNNTFKDEFAVTGLELFGTISIDESAVTVQNVIDAYALGYRRVGLKACKSITMTLRMAQKAKELGMEIDIQDLTQVGYGMIVSASLAAWLGCPIEANGWKNVANAQALLPAENCNGIWLPQHGGFTTSNLTGPGITAV